MKIGMNSQTLRIITEEIVTDYHITDGLTSAFMMKMMNGINIIDSLKTYESIEVKSQLEPLSWGTDKDKFVDINYIDVNLNKIEFVEYAQIPSRPTNKIYMVSTPTTKSPWYELYSKHSTSTSTYTRTESNYCNFKSMFGN